MDIREGMALARRMTFLVGTENMHRLIREIKKTDDIITNGFYSFSEHPVQIEILLDRHVYEDGKCRITTEEFCKKVKKILEQKCRIFHFWTGGDSCPPELSMEVIAEEEVMFLVIGLGEVKVFPGVSITRFRDRGRELHTILEEIEKMMKPKLREKISRGIKRIKSKF